MALKPKRGRPRKGTHLLSAEIYTRVSESQAEQFKALAERKGYDKPAEAVRRLIEHALDSHWLPPKPTSV